MPYHASIIPFIISNCIGVMIRCLKEPQHADVMHGRTGFSDRTREKFV